jgi:hypothetical protein
VTGRNPYTMAREIEARAVAIAAEALSGTVPAAALSDRLLDLCDDVRTLRRALVRGAAIPTPTEQSEV